MNLDFPRGQKCQHASISGTIQIFYCTVLEGSCLTDHSWIHTVTMTQAHWMPWRDRHWDKEWKTPPQEPRDWRAWSLRPWMWTIYTKTGDSDRSTFHHPSPPHTHRLLTLMGWERTQRCHCCYTHMGVLGWLFSSTGSQKHHIETFLSWPHFTYLLLPALHLKEYRGEKT
jgi:hypothetical protein